MLVEEFLQAGDGDMVVAAAPMAMCLTEHEEVKTESSNSWSWPFWPHAALASMSEDFERSRCDFSVELTTWKSRPNMETTGPMFGGDVRWFARVFRPKDH